MEKAKSTEARRRLTEKRDKDRCNTAEFKKLEEAKAWYLQT